MEEPQTSELPPAVIQIGHYVLGKTLGQGAMGKVKIAEHSETGHKVAVKIMNREKMRNMDVVAKIRREITNQQRFRHPHIIRLYQAISTPSDFFLIMEYAPGGELFAQIVAKGRLKERDARLYFQQMISAIDYCHRHRVVHRDIKPENILLDSYKNIKIADFGLSTVLTDGEFLKTSCGSPNYASPEILSGQCYAGPEVDIWSCGVILFAMCAGRLPFDSKSVTTLFNIINNGEYQNPAYFSKPLKVLIGKLLDADPKKRASTKDILEDEWFRVNLPAYLFLKDYADVSKVDLECVKEIADNSELSVADVKEAVANGNPVDPVVVAYYLLAENFSTLGVSGSADGPDTPERVAERRRVSHGIIAGLCIEKEARVERMETHQEGPTKLKTLACSKAAGEPRRQRWCRENCELCPRWAGVTECVYGPFLPTLERCETCDQLQKPGCSYNSQVEPANIEDLGDMVKSFARSADSHSSGSSDGGGESDCSNTSANSDCDLGFVKTSVRVAQRRFKKQRWHLGIRSNSRPEDIMLEIYRIMLSVGIEWHVEGLYSCLVRPKAAPGDDGDFSQLSGRVSLYQLDSRSGGGYLLDFRLLSRPTDQGDDRGDDWSDPDGEELGLEAMEMAPKEPSPNQTPWIPILERKSELMQFFLMASKVIKSLSSR